MLSQLYVLSSMVIFFPMKAEYTDDPCAALVLEVVNIICSHS